MKRARSNSSLHKPWSISSAFSCVSVSIRWFGSCCAVFFISFWTYDDAPARPSFPSSGENILVAPCVFKEDYMSTCAPCHQVPRLWPGIISDDSGCIPIAKMTKGNKPAGNLPGLRRLCQRWRADALKIGNPPCPHLPAKGLRVCTRNT